MAFKFEGLEVWKAALDYIDLAYALAEMLPREEEFNLKSQLRRAATSVALNIAEGSTGQTDREQTRLLGLALRSLIETVACQRIIQRRAYSVAPESLQQMDQAAQSLARQLHTMRRTLDPERKWLHEQSNDYISDGTDV